MILPVEIVVKGALYVRRGHRPMGADRRGDVG
jgi:hypothetical protein